MDQSSSNAAGLAAAFTGIGLIIDLAIVVLFVVCFWKIFTKAGFNGALSLLLFVPCVNIILVVWFAFTEWPILRGGGGGYTSGASPYVRPGPGGPAGPGAPGGPAAPPQG